MALLIERGSPLPFGATPQPNGVNFSLFARHASDVTLVLFDPARPEPAMEIALDPHYHRTGDVWHVFLRGLTPDVQYCYRIDRHPNFHNSWHRYDPSKLVLDPFARCVVGGEQWGEPLSQRPLRRGAMLAEPFDWGEDQPLNIPLADSVIYELHVRGFTRHATAAVAHPGTFRGLIDKIPYLLDLGITAVELLPVYDFEEADTNRRNPFTGEPLLNYWGYQPISFFALRSAYAADRRPTGPAREFKEMVKAFHAAGIEVILDVVFNHTAEGNELGPTYSFRGIDNAVYYMLESGGHYRNYSGCGNTLNCNHPVVRAMINSCLRYWVMEMHVDGFRFDLASILGRGQDGSVLANPPLLESLALDPILANTKLIAEAWDAAGLYQVGSFPAWGRWAEWNGNYRDDVRKFVKSDTSQVPALASRLLGSPDLYHPSGRFPYHSINYVTCHDGFTMADLFSYNEKHNEANGEDNRDGVSVTHSWNCGAEGPTNDPEINRLRLRLQKNLTALLLISGGVPMILGGDEFGRTQKGNNNAYCQDNDVSWVDWSFLPRHRELHRFFRRMIAFRHRHECLRRVNWDQNGRGPHPYIEFHGTELGSPDWSRDSRALAAHWSCLGEQIYLLANSYWEPLKFQLPDLPWRRFADTALRTPHDIVEPGEEKPLRHPTRYEAAPRSVVILVA